MLDDLAVAPNNRVPVFGARRAFQEQRRRAPDGCQGDVEVGRARVVAVPERRKV